MLSKYLRGKGYLEQYFSEFIKLVGIIKKKNYIFPLHCRFPVGVGGRCLILPPVLPSRVAHSRIFLRLFIDLRKFFWDFFFFFLFNQAKEWLEKRTLWNQPA